MNVKQEMLRYLTLVSSFMIILFFIVACVNFVVNPYGIYKFVKIEGFNSIKLPGNMRMQKAYTGRRLEPDGLLMGTSRALALNENHDGWNTNVKSTMNLALTGASIYEIRRYLQHQVAIGSVKQVVMGLDLFSFNIYQPPRVTFDETRLSVSAAGNNNLPPIREILTTLLSLNALNKSLKTLCAQIGANWLHCRWYPMKQESLESFIKKYGQRQAFLREEEDHATLVYFPEPSRQFALANEKTSSFQELEMILAIAKEKNIDLRLFISPVHSRQLELIYALGLWKTFEQWKQGIVDLLDNYSRAPGNAYYLWDFSGFNSITTEPVPKRNDHTTKMQWYKESSHYTKEVGELLLDMVFEQELSDKYASLEFGVKLTGANLQSHIATTRENHIAWRNANPIDVEEIGKLVRHVNPVKTPVIRD